MIILACQNENPLGIYFWILFCDFDQLNNIPDDLQLIF